MDSTQTVAQIVVWLAIAGGTVIALFILSFFARFAFELLKDALPFVIFIAGIISLICFITSAVHIVQGDNDLMYRQMFKISGCVLAAYVFLVVVLKVVTDRKG